MWLAAPAQLCQIRDVSAPNAAVAQLDRFASLLRERGEAFDALGVSELQRTWSRFDWYDFARLQATLTERLSLSRSPSVAECVAHAFSAPLPLQAEGADAWSAFHRDPTSDVAFELLLKDYSARGDPQADLMALQRQLEEPLAGSSRLELIGRESRARTELLGFELAQALMTSGTTWYRGFVTRVSARLDVDLFQRLLGLGVSLPLASLRVSGLSATRVAALLARARPGALRSLSIEGRRAPLDATLLLSALGALEVLDVHADLRLPPTHPALAIVSAATVGTSPSALFAGYPGLRSVTFVGESPLVFERGAGGLLEVGLVASGPAALRARLTEAALPANSDLALVLLVDSVRGVNGMVRALVACAPAISRLRHVSIVSAVEVDLRPLRACAPGVEFSVYALDRAREQGE